MPVKRPGEDEVRPERFSAIVLAAGAGRRFGGGKLTAPYRGGVLLDGALDAAFAAPAAEVIVTTGADPGVARAATAHAEARGELARLVVAEAEGWAEGLSASLRVGVAAVPELRDGAFLFLGDMPLVPRGLAAELATWLTGDIVAVTPEVEGRPAHPTLIGRALFAEVAALSGDRGARGLMEEQGERLARVAVTDPSALFDVDTRAAIGL
jgi:molybdenum cofactor cytidylyltransferase